MGAVNPSDGTPQTPPTTESSGTTGQTGAGGTSAETLQTEINKAIEQMREIMLQSIAYNTETTRITTLLGQNANRAAKQTPQG